MPLGYQGTRLWNESLGVGRDEAYSEERGRFRSAYHSFRERAALLAAEIPQDLRDYTVHDATHLDALWELADLIAGPEISISPVEGFVLGGAFLIHDLGMGLAAWPGGMKELEDDPGWNDIVATCLKDRLGHPPSPDDFTELPEAIVREAKEILLREKHAARASDLALVSWRIASSGEMYHLIDDVDLRNNFGRLIGEIAASHWTDVDKLIATFPQGIIGAPTNCPDEWTVDPLKLACLLRLGDAAHLDARRAPGFLQALRNPSNQASDHWTFQGRLHRPLRQEDRLVYSSARPFDEHEAYSWWLCFDSLNMVDRQLHAVDSLLADLGRPRFAARSVKGVDSPRRLKDMIPTRNWTPVDATLAVTNLPGLVRNLGGESLYGQHPEVALRELIQNASDASLALSVMRPEHHIEPLSVTLARRDDSWWLDVTDVGIGMSSQVMTGPLLDFGSSYWGTQLMREESPGLAGSTFRPTGRFGIGFFSVFMLGDQVKITSRRFDEAPADTRVLEFRTSLSGRPLLRPARQDEIRYTTGTVVSVLLQVEPEEKNGLLSPRSFHHFSDSPLTLNQLCAKLCLALPVDLVTVDRDGLRTPCVRGNDWKTISGIDLLARLSHPAENVYPGTKIEIDMVANSLRTIENNGEIIARATLAPVPPAGRVNNEHQIVGLDGVVTAGGLRASSIGGVVGIFVGSATKADRAEADILTNIESLAEWASEQAVIWKDELRGLHGERSIAVSLLALLGADLSGNDICRTHDRYLTGQELLEWAEGVRGIVAIDSYTVDFVQEDGGFTIWDRHNHKRVTLDENILLVEAPGMYGDWDIWESRALTKRWRDESNDIAGKSNIEIDELEYYVSSESLAIYCLRQVYKMWSASGDAPMVTIGFRNGVRPRVPVDIGKYASGEPFSAYPIWVAARE